MRPLLLLLLSLTSTNAQRTTEKLDRGLIAIQTTNGVFLSWRNLATDPAQPTYQLTRNNTKLPATTQTWFLDTNTIPNATYQLADTKPITPRQNYHPIKLQHPPGYTANDGSVADLDADGEYEIILKLEQRPIDTAARGLSGQTILQAYKLNSDLLWTIHLGKNIREGAHYTQFIAYDLDGDGSAELACKTADGTIDGAGKIIGDPQADWRDTNSTSQTFGRVLKGPEYFTIFSGKTGAALATTNYIPGRGDLGAWGGRGGNGGNDRVGNRADRFLAGVAYLDGKLPSVLMARGYYGRSVIAAWDWRDGKLTSRWVFDSKDGENPYSGQGGHHLRVADVDNDGRDEIIYHAMVIDDDGKGLFTTGFRHGDAQHVSDFDPEHPGLEIFTVHENEENTAQWGTPGVAFFEAATGKPIWTFGPGIDVGRGLAADIDPRHPGAELWGGPAGLRTVKGERIGDAPRSVNFAIWWDGDLLRELLDRNRIDKWDWERSALTNLFTADGAVSNNGTKATPVLSADICGDWREEVIFRTPDSSELRIYSTTIPTPHRLRCLMQDSQYRLSVAAQNVGYNQPPHPSFFLGEAMRPGGADGDKAPKP